MEGVVLFADCGGHEGPEPLGYLSWSLCRMNTDPGVHTLEFSVAQLSSDWQVRPLDLGYLIWEETTSCFCVFWLARMWKENKLRKKMVKAVHKVKKYSSNSIFFKWGNIQICKFDYLKQFNGISYIHDADCSILKAEHSLGEHFILLILRK